MSVVEITPWALFLKGGPLMWPILLCSVASLAIVAERIFFLDAEEKATRRIRASVMQAVRAGDLKGAVVSCGEQEGCLAAVFKAGILQMGRGKNVIEEDMEAASRRQIPALEKGVSVLGAMGVTAPLLGCLGAILGVASAVRAFQLRLEAENPSALVDLAGHVFGALVPAAFGLMVSILVCLAYYYLASRILEIVTQMEDAARELEHILVSVPAGDGSVEEDA